MDNILLLLSTSLPAAMADVCTCRTCSSKERYLEFACNFFHLVLGTRLNGNCQSIALTQNGERKKYVNIYLHLSSCNIVKGNLQDNENDDLRPAGYRHSPQ